jgi:SAM-dependent methyltransferase
VVSAGLHEHAGVVGPGWAESDLETVDRCAVCRSNRSTVLYTGLMDLTVGVPGTWTLRGCKRCGSAYLDPRPTPATIGRAYASYYTHRGPVTSGPGTTTERILRRLHHGYLNRWRGYSLVPTTSLGSVVVPLLPQVRAEAERLIHHLPKSKEGARLLDVGCGNGAFLDLMRWQGWDGVGIDADGDAVAIANSRGVPARVGTDTELERLPDQAFDAVSIHHLIEHSYDPVATLGQAYRLLRPGGLLWVATPNLDSFGHRHFGRDWRGLEPPRHLALFTSRSLRDAVTGVGFHIIGPSRGGWQARWYHEASADMAASAGSTTRHSARLRWRALAADLAAWVQPDGAEEAAFLAQRPTGSPVE